jgi:hypothetical protein
MPEELTERVRDLLVQLVVAGVVACPRGQWRRVRDRLGVQDRRGAEQVIHRCSPPSIA